MSNKYKKISIVLLSLVVALSGCSKNNQSTDIPKAEDVPVIEEDQTALETELMSDAGELFGTEIQSVFTEQSIDGIYENDGVNVMTVVNKGTVNVGDNLAIVRDGNVVAIAECRRIVDVSGDDVNSATEGEDVNIILLGKSCELSRDNIFNGDYIIRTEDFLAVDDTVESRGSVPMFLVNTEESSFVLPESSLFSTGKEEIRCGSLDIEVPMDSDEFVNNLSKLNYTWKYYKSNDEEATEVTDDFVLAPNSTEPLFITINPREDGLRGDYELIVVLENVTDEEQDLWHLLITDVTVKAQDAWDIEYRGLNLQDEPELENFARVLDSDVNDWGWGLGSKKELLNEYFDSINVSDNYGRRIKEIELAYSYYYHTNPDADPYSLVR